MRKALTGLNGGKSDYGCYRKKLCVLCVLCGEEILFRLIKIVLSQFFTQCTAAYAEHLCSFALIAASLHHDSFQ